jgi:hypothetical protein
LGHNQKESEEAAKGAGKTQKKVAYAHAFGHAEKAAEQGPDKAEQEASKATSGAAGGKAKVAPQSGEETEVHTPEKPHRATPAIVEKEPGSPAQVQPPKKKTIKEVPGDEAVNGKQAEEVRSRQPREPQVVKIIDKRWSPQFENLLDRFDSLLEKFDELLRRQADESRIGSKSSALEDLLLKAKESYQFLRGLAGAGPSGMHRQLTRLAVQLSAAAELLAESHGVLQAGQPTRDTLLGLNSTALIAYRNTLLEPLLKNSIDLVLPSVY